MAADICVGDRVMRRTGKDKRVGVVLALYPNPMYPNGKPRAWVRFEDRTRIGGDGYHRSTIRLTALVRVDPEPSTDDIRRMERQEAEAERFYGVDARLDTFGDW